MNKCESMSVKSTCISMFEHVREHVHMYIYMYMCVLIAGHKGMK